MPAPLPIGRAQVRIKSWELCYEVKWKLRVRHQGWTRVRPFCHNFLKIKDFVRRWDWAETTLDPYSGRSEVEMWKGGAPLWQLRGLKWELGGTGNESSSSQASYLQALLCNVWTDTCSAVWDKQKKKDEIPNLDAVSSAMERQQAYLSSLNLKLCVRLLEVHLNDISRVLLHLKA